MPRVRLRPPPGPRRQVGGGHVDAALHDHYGFDTAVGRVIVTLELHADQPA
ncbi:hypothetical protein [Streptomyces sp. CBMA123]|uniref:hypothetical protein n=1 Tax=Streptomyces sp. CBMA123 TaxID=1896313 RepID=UPI0016621552|nr:hypothetical protein [Streptomyces sp. CBMA123]